LLRWTYEEIEEEFGFGVKVMPVLNIKDWFA
jgi:hypothetical protein